MTLINRPTPTIRDAMTRLFDEALWRPVWLRELEAELLPALDVYTTPEAVVAKVALPGVQPEDVDVAIADELVTISGRFSAPAEGEEVGYSHRELGHGAFSRHFSVPVPIKPAAASAIFEDGLLTITVPRAEEIRPTHLKVEIAPKQAAMEAADIGSPGGPVLPR
jgi:HSP20 family protein